VIRGTTRVAAVIGWPIHHSLSPAIHNAAFAETGIDAVLVPIDVPPDGLGVVVSALRAMRALGASVTVPHKVAVAALCDDLAPTARAIGAVNCLQLDGDRVIGHNTDAAGFVDALAEIGFALAGKRAVLLGAGGAARAIAVGLGRECTVEIVARRPLDWAPSQPWDAMRDALAGADLVIDCTPTALGEGEDAFVDALPLDALPADALVVSLVYHRRPLLLERAAARGHRVLDGASMLVHQAARAFTIWTNHAAPIDAMRAAVPGNAR
jgi:shikimate dehydrogenase